jgi:hypothetical protein
LGHENQELLIIVYLYLLDESCTNLAEMWGASKLKFVAGEAAAGMMSSQGWASQSKISSPA